jgi:hypothetical protein
MLRLALQMHLLGGGHLFLIATPPVRERAYMVFL